jgi:hypothetical protein
MAGYLLTIAMFTICSICVQIKGFLHDLDIWGCAKGKREMVRENHLRNFVSGTLIMLLR